LALTARWPRVGQSAPFVLRRAERVTAFADDRQQLAVMVKGILGVLESPRCGEGKDGVLLLTAPLGGIETTTVMIESRQNGGYGFDQAVEQPALRRPALRRQGVVGTKASAAEQQCRKQY